MLCEICCMEKKSFVRCGMCDKYVCQKCFVNNIRINKKLNCIYCKNNINLILIFEQLNCTNIYISQKYIKNIIFDQVMILKKNLSLTKKKKLR